MRVLIWLVIAFAVYTWVRRKASQLTRPNGDAASRAPDRVESMLKCTRCGTYFPASEAVFDPAGAPYCSEAHRQS